MTEARIQADILRYLRRRKDCFAFKAEVSSERGTPDIICCRAGRFYAFEVKTQKGKLSALQNAQLKRIKNAGGLAEVVRCIEDVKKLLESEGRNGDPKERKAL